MYFIIENLGILDGGIEREKGDGKRWEGVVERIEGIWQRSYFDGEFKDLGKDDLN